MNRFSIICSRCSGKSGESTITSFEMKCIELCRFRSYRYGLDEKEEGCSEIITINKLCGPCQNDVIKKHIRENHTSVELVD